MLENTSQVLAEGALVPNQEESQQSRCTRCLFLLYKWHPCGHKQAIPRMEGDCELPEDSDPSNHDRELIALSGSGLCPVCRPDSGETMALALRVRLDGALNSLEGILNDDRYAEFRQQHADLPVWRHPEPFDSDDDLCDWVLHLEGLLATGFTLRHSPPDSPTDSEVTVRPPSAASTVHSSKQRSSISCSVIVPPQAESLTSLDSQTCGQAGQSHPHVLLSSSPAYQQSTPPSVDDRHHPSTLQGRDAFRHEFVPGPNWVTHRLSRRLAAIVRNKWQRTHSGPQQQSGLGQQEGSSRLG